MGTRRGSHEATPPPNRDAVGRRGGTRFFRRSPLPRKFFCANRWNYEQEPLGNAELLGLLLDQTPGIEANTAVDKRLKRAV